MTGHSVDLPGPKTYAAALASTIVGAIRPRQPDRRFLDSLTDAGLPDARTVVRVRPLRQIPSTAPAFIVEGRRRPPHIRMGLTTFLIEHPDATFLVDPSVCEDVHQRALFEMPATLRKAVAPPPDIIEVRDMLAEVGLDPADIAFALPTHLHWDHVCGLLDLPGLEIKAHDAEWTWAMGTSVAPSPGVRASLVDRPVDTYELDGPSVLTFTRSHDLFGDGSVLLVDLAGHSPGSVGVLLRTARGPVLIAGDAAWHSAQIEDIRQKAGFPGCFVDGDRRETFRTLHRLHAARHRAIILPTHDHDASSAYAAEGADEHAPE